MLKKGLIILLCFGPFASILSAQPELQDSIPVKDSIKNVKNIFYLELFGNSGLYSFNYERILINKPGFMIMTRAGAGWWMADRHLSHSYVLEENVCIGKNGKFFETGIGFTLQRKWLTDCDDSLKFGNGNLWWGLLRLGFRFQPREKGSVFRVGFTPLFYYHDDCQDDFPYFQFFGGISYGIVF